MTLPDGPFETWGAGPELPFPVEPRPPVFVVDNGPTDDWPTLAEGGRWRELCRVEIEGTPKAQPRARGFALKRCPAGHFFQAKAAACPHCGKPGAITTRMHDPSTAEGWKAQVAEAFLPYRPAEPLGGFVRIDFEIFQPRPKSLSAEVRAAYGGGKLVPKAAHPEGASVAEICATMGASRSTVESDLWALAGLGVERYRLDHITRGWLWRARVDPSPRDPQPDPIAAGRPTLCGYPWVESLEIKASDPVVVFGDLDDLGGRPRGRR